MPTQLTPLENQARYGMRKFMTSLPPCARLDPKLTLKYCYTDMGHGDGGPGGLGLPTFLLSKNFFYIIVKENIIIDNF